MCNFGNEFINFFLVPGAASLLPGTQKSQLVSLWTTNVCQCRPVLGGRDGLVWVCSPALDMVKFVHLPSLFLTCGVQLQTLYWRCGGPKQVSLFFFSVFFFLEVSLLQACNRSTTPGIAA